MKVNERENKRESATFYMFNQYKIKQVHIARFYILKYVIKI